MLGVEQADDRGEDGFAAQIAAPDVPADPAPEFWQRFAEIEQAVELGLLLLLTEQRVITILLAASRIDPRRLQVTVGVGAEPGVGVGGCQADRVQPVDLGAIRDPFAGGIEISEEAANPLPADPGLGVAAMPQHVAFGFTRAIVRRKRPASGRVPVHPSKETREMPLIPNSRILIVATDGFEEWELFGPREILQKRGAEVVLASLKTDPIQATIHDDPGKTIRPDLTIDDARAEDFDAVILPGGVRNPDTLRLHPNVIRLIRDFDDLGKPIGAICHGPWLLVEADLLDGRTATSWPSIRTDLRNAGANVVDEAAVTDGNIVTSRNPQDVEAFTSAIIDLVEQAPDVTEIRNPAEVSA